MTALKEVEVKEVCVTVTKFTKDDAKINIINRVSLRFLSTGDNPVWKGPIIYQAGLLRNTTTI